MLKTTADDFATQLSTFPVLIGDVLRCPFCPTGLCVVQPPTLYRESKHLWYDMRCSMCDREWAALRDLTTGRWEVG